MPKKLSKKLMLFDDKIKKGYALMLIDEWYEIYEDLKKLCIEKELEEEGLKKKEEKKLTYYDLLEWLETFKGYQTYKPIGSYGPIDLDLPRGYIPIWEGAHTGTPERTYLGTHVPESLPTWVISW